MKITVVTPTIRPEGLYAVGQSLKNQTFKDFEWLVEINVSGEPDFNKAMNRMLRRAQGELIVSIQDFTTIPNDGLQNFWDAYKLYPDTFFTAPLGKDDLKNQIRYDWRIHRDKECNWMEWEIDWGAAPLFALKEIGGFDEFLDEQKESWTYGNVNTAFRANELKYKFMNVKDNVAIAYDHDSSIEHPFRKFNDPIYHNARLDEFRMGKTLNYL